ncbi:MULTISPECIES: protein translocase subunit SecDF [Zobellia]|uniref:Multifunctional fusion protein n=1 Tax=Zobellia galactanivorans (strain DSM 12802 / CCUG 47099 / CIP 106680 / NCIMB 13871 / Dsij) TaxID=63186 RepID=G0LCF8_ZOBGA|nr:MULTISPECIES: protein translocase subunit SecDF [Zobellia]OWW25104.1 protein translocase subunit SecDF [Zobellia sp. OII3]CAZ96899.1 Protein-export membrane protein secD [Zobellia galactanivorans]
MQNKGLIKLFALLFGLVSIYQLSYTFIGGKVENEAKRYAESRISDAEENYVSKREALEARYLDSIGDQSILGFTNYNEAKKKELNKGLDLKGGINVTLQISVKDILKGLANNTKNPVFNKALADAEAASKNSDDTFIELFFNAFDKIKGDTKLASPDIFANKELSGEVNFQMTDDEVKPIIRRKIDESIVSAFEVLRERIDGFGVTQPNIQREGNSGRILVELPGARDIARAQDLLSSTAQLEFWETYQPNDPELQGFFFQANEKLKSLVDTDEADEPVKKESELDSLLSDVSQDSLDIAGQRNPLFDKFQLGAPSYAVGVAAIQDTAEIGSYLRMKEIRRLLPASMQFAKFLWERPTEGSEIVELYALKSNRDGTPRISGDVVNDARDEFVNGKPAVTMSMNTKGAKEWEKLTGDAYNNRTGIAIVLDNKVYTAPGVSSGPISGGRSEITGTFTVNETKDIANVLRAGKLPASAEIIQSEVVGPSLGQEAIDSGFMSFMIAMAIVLVWMVFYYGKAGGFADIALLLNILLIFGVLTSLSAVLTLPGIAGIVLTIGMSVDANVLIFERIKEELAKGKGKSLAVADGFGNALSSILDANITTGLTAIILFIFGSGPIKGFATTLLIGIVTSLFTAIFITRLLVDWYIDGKGRTLEFSTGLTKNLFKNINIDFLSKRKMAYILSAILVGVSVFTLLTNGLQQGVDFIGGRSYQVRFEQAVSASEIASELNDVFGSGTNVKTFGDANQIKITTPYKVDVEGIEVDNEIQNKLYTALQKYLPDGISEQSFKIGSGDKSIGILQSVKVGPTIADDIKNNAFLAILGSLAVVFLYILFRFRKWQFSLGAVAAVFHDVMIVLGIFSLFGTVMPFNMEIDQAFIAAILTVIGYSLNDTVVVFDRIREIIGERGWRGGDNINLALNSTLSRTLNTSLTTLVVLLAIFTFGGESLRGFMFAMIIGIIVGTYSSLFIATPVMYDTLNKTARAGGLVKDDAEAEK